MNDIKITKCTGEGEWVCNNGEPEYYGFETGYEDECVDYEGRK